MHNFYYYTIIIHMIEENVIYCSMEDKIIYVHNIDIIFK